MEKVGEGAGMGLEGLVVLEVAQVELAEDVLEGEEVLTILNDDVLLHGLEVVLHSPHASPASAPAKQPHSILIN